MKDYLLAASGSGVRFIGFTSHAPLPFPCSWCMKPEAFQQYLDEIDSAQAGFPDVAVSKGLEVDYIPDVISPADFATSLDYTIGSIHFVGQFGDRRWEIDNTREVFSEGLHHIFHDDVREAVSAYFSLTREMIEESSPDVIGHLDKIKVNAMNTGCDESDGWYRDEVDKTLRLIRKAGTIVEVNTRGLYKKKSQTPYPSPWILERILHWNMPITLNSDAHHPEDLTREFAATAKLLSNIGFRELQVFRNGQWVSTPFNENGLDL